MSYLLQLEQGEAPEIQVVDRGQHLALFIGVTALVVFAQLEPGSSVYVIPAAVLLYGPRHQRF